ncbi:MAG: MurR/RpiR family transcriptional regulator [bacterium]
MKSDIKELRERIKQKIPYLTESQKIIANYIVENPQKFALSSVRELENELRTSKSTIVRLAQALGYNGFYELKSSFLKKIRRDLEPIPRYKTYLTESQDKIDFIKLIVEESQSNIQDTLHSIDEDQYQKALTYIENANHVYTIGLGVSSYVAQIASYLFTRISIKSNYMTHGGVSFMEQIINFSPEDVILAFSFPPYSSETIDAVRYAHERKIRIISITDRVTNKIVQFSDASLQVVVESVTISNSIIAVLVLLYAIVAQIGYDFKNKTLKTIETIEHLRKEKTKM